MAVTREIALKDMEKENIMTDIQKILNEREKTHGDYGDHSIITQDLKRIIKVHNGELVDHQKETLDMIAHKIGRILAGDPDFRDHWADIAGYATLSADRCTK